MHQSKFVTWRARRMTNRMDQFESILREDVSLYRHLYDTALKQHRDHVNSQNSWTEIGRTLGNLALFHSLVFTGSGFEYYELLCKQR